MDLVVVDAPCTGSGTWRRRPDAKWRLGERQLEARMAEQAAILDAASRFVAPGGRLAYITCSVFAEENDRQIAAFLTRSPDFGRTAPAELWQRSSLADDLARFTDEGILLSPLRTGTDGFFMASLERPA
jgi:16S rRNA (cytosine967-C5)-methyltransferase